MPKQDHTPAVSLFSFQDIITSITGIMFLVVLLLLLFILEAEPEAAGREPREKLKEAAARVEELRRQLDLNRAADRELLRKIGNCAAAGWCRIRWTGISGWTRCWRSAAPTESGHWHWRIRACMISAAPVR